MVIYISLVSGGERVLPMSDLCSPLLMGLTPTLSNSHKSSTLKEKMHSLNNCAYDKLEVQANMILRPSHYAYLRICSFQCDFPLLVHV